MGQARDEQGNIWEVDAQGNAVRLIQAAGGQPPADPSFQYQGQKAAADAQKASADASITAATQGATITKANAEARKAIADAEKAEKDLEEARKGGGANKEKAGAYQAVINQINRVQELYAKSIGQTSGPSGILDYLPLPANQNFTTAGTALGDQGTAAFKVPGMGSQSDADAARFVAANQPQASDYDSVALEKVRALRQRLEANMAADGLPAPQWDYTVDGAPVDRSTALTERDRTAPGANPQEFARSGSSITERDRQVQAALQDQFNRGADISTLAGIADTLNYRLPEGFDQYVAQRDAAIARGEQFRINIGTPETGEGMGFLGNAITSAPGTAATMAVNATTGGLVDEIGGMFGGPGTTEAIDAAKGMMRQENPLSAFGGEMLGAVAPMVGAGRLAGMASKALPAIGGSRAAILGDVGYSAAYGAGEQNDNRALGALIGGGAGVAGNAIGSYVAAPIVRGVQGTKAGKAAINRTRGLFGKPAIAVQPALAPEQAMALKSGLDIDQVMSTLTDAQRLNLPMALADADPRLRMLAGSATRKSPDVRALAERNLEPRQMGQAERAMGAIRRDFAAPVNMRDTREEIIQQGRTAAAPLYEQAYGAPIIQTPELAAVLGTPAGRGALGRANTIAANERRNPQGMGFALDADGNVVLNPTPVDAYGAQAVARSELTDAQQAYKAARQASDGPSMESASARVLAARNALREADNALAAAPREGTAATMPGYTTQSIDYVKRGLDDILEERRDPITRQLVLDEAGRAEQGVRRSLVNEMDRLNPAYRGARGAYEQYAKQATSLDEGYGATSRQIGQDDLARMLGGMEDPNLGRFQTGYATGLTEQVEKMPFGSNPYTRIYGSPDQQAKIGMAFPEGAGNFARQADLERDMAKTYQEALGGSPTAARLNADQQFDMMPGVGMAADVATSAMAGAPVTPNLIARMGRGLTDSARVGFGTRRADAIGPVLLDTDPQAAMDFILKAQQEKALRDAYVTRTRRTGGLFGVPFAVGAVGATNQ